MDDFVRSAVSRNRRFHSILERFDLFRIRNCFKYSATFCKFLAYHTMICCFFSIVMIFLNPAQNPCHGYFSAYSFQDRDFFSFILTSSGFLYSCTILDILHVIDSNPRYELNQRYDQVVYILFLVITNLGTLLAFWLFIFIISEGHFLSSWSFILDTYIQQNIQTLTCSKKLELVYLAVLSFACVVAGSVTTIRLLSHMSLWKRVVSSEMLSEQEINRARVELLRHHRFQLLAMDRVHTENDFIPPRPNRQRREDQNLIPDSVHSTHPPDLIPGPQFETNQIQHNSDVETPLNGALAADQSEMTDRCEPSAAINAYSLHQQPDLADTNVHLQWIDELKQYFANRGRNHYVPESTDAVLVPEAGAHLKSCCNFFEKIPEQLRSASITPPSSSSFSRERFREKLNNMFDSRIAKSSSRQDSRRGAISGPSCGSAFDEYEVNNGENAESFDEPMASVTSTKTEKLTLKELVTSPRQKYYGDPPLAQPDEVPFISTRGSYQVQSEVGEALGLPPEDNSNKCHKVQGQSQESIPLGRSLIHGNSQASRGSVWQRRKSDFESNQLSDAGGIEVKSDDVEDKMQFLPKSTSSSKSPSLSPKLGSHENEVEEQHTERRDSRTFAMDLDTNDSSQSDGSNESHENESYESHSDRRDSRTFATDLDDEIEFSKSESSDESSGRQENRSRLSSESTDSGLFLDNLFYSSNRNFSK